MNITQDLVDEILSRLPVKSLIRFKIVCKIWHFTICSHSFIAKHIKNQTTNKKILICHDRTYADPAVSICSEVEKREEDDDDDDTRTLFHQSDDEQYVIRHMPVDHVKPYPPGVVIVGTCNGIVCLMSVKFQLDLELYDRFITLWNPATRDFKTVPTFRPCLPQAGAARNDVFGFGFDVANNDYKAMILVPFLKEEYCGTEVEEYNFEMKIYSLSTNSWREFECPGLSTTFVSRKGTGILLGKERLCWLAARDYSGVDGVILSFDMGKEVFQKTPLPSDYVHLEWPKSGTELFNLHDSIALVRYEAEATEKTFSIWTIKELAQQNSSWTKMANVGPLPGVCPIGFWQCKNSNNLLFLFKHNYAYNRGVPESIRYKKAMKAIYMNNRGQIMDDRLMAIKVKNSIGLPTKVLTYVETLVPLNRDHSESSICDLLSDLNLC